MPHTSRRNMGRTQEGEIQDRDACCEPESDSMDLASRGRASGLKFGASQSVGNCCLSGIALKPECLRP